MTLALLDNPFWSSLQSRHAIHALGDSDVVRFPADIAPFLGIRDALDGSDAPTLFESIAAVVAPGESVYLIGPAPKSRPGWELHPLRPLAQMICTEPTECEGDERLPEIIALDARHVSDVRALTAQVFPLYFRERTMLLGRYFGIYEGTRLAAMIGERLGTETTREMSGICTHPDFLGRGYARRLTAMLTRETLAQGLTPFLHVGYDNPRAKGMYERLGYRLRSDVPFWRLRRSP